jgi:peptidyl-prolyl cis-trans isomerase D
MVLDYMRRKTKTFLYVTVPLIVVSFVFWGTVADFGGPGEQALVEIGDIKITRQQFVAQYQSVRQAALENFPGEMSPEIEEIIKQQALDGMIQKVLLEQEMDRFDIVVSTTEVQDSIKRYPEFQTDGKFDPAKWNATIADTRINWAYITEQEQQSLKTQKIVDMIQSAARVTEDEIKDKYRHENDKVEIEFVALKVSEFVADTEVSNDEISAFYDEHKDDYAVPAKVELSYVEIKKTPSQADFDEAEEYCRGILDRVQAGDDFAELAEDYSDDSRTRADGGDRGFMRKNQIREKEYAQAAFAMEPGQVSDVVKTDIGLHIIKLEETKGAGSEKEVRTRHIFVEAKPSEYTLTSLGETAVRLAVEAIGSTLEQAAETTGLSVSTTPEFSENSSVIPGIGLVSEIAEILPGLTEGKASDMIETDKAYYVIQVNKRIPERIRELSEIEDRIKGAAKAEKALALTKVRAEEIAAEVNNNGTSLVDIEGAPEPQQAEFSRRGYAPGMPYVRGLANKVFEMTEGTAADPVESGGNAYVIVLKRKIEADPEGYEEQKDRIRDEMLAERRGQVVSDYFETLRENAGVKIDQDMFESV